jgi:hypothetical protein
MLAPGHIRDSPTVHTVPGKLTEKTPSNIHTTYASYYSTIYLGGTTKTRHNSLLGGMRTQDAPETFFSLISLPHAYRYRTRYLRNKSR